MGSCFSSRVKDNGKSSVLFDPNLSTSGTHSHHSHRTEGEILNSGTVKNFSLEELKIATRNFKSDSVVGEGGFGTVFKGWIDETTLVPSKSNTGQIVAIKRLNQESAQGHREWLTEISYLGQLSHPNLVKLIGYCLEDEHRLLVYEFMPGGSLDHHLFKSKGKFKAFPWFLRIKVALDAAKGLAFLHSDPVKVIYRDFKAANILLDSDFNAKLSDFGLARDGPSGASSHVSTRVMGTYGYADPEYMSTGHLTTTSDVYSFGVFLLELLTGKRALDYSLPAKEQNLVKWAQPFLTSKRKVQQIVDSKLKTQYGPDEAVRLASLAVQCISTDPRSRPTMSKVVRVLQQLLDSLEKPRNGEPVSKSGGGECEKSGLTEKLFGCLFK